MPQAFHLDVWTDQNEKRSYAAMAETREEALALAREQRPADWGARKVYAINLGTLDEA